MATFAILPVKGFGEAKQRLATELGPGVRRALAEAMFSDVLRALRRTRQIDRILVVTGDGAAEQIAAGYGAGVIHQEPQGHNPAASLGVEEARRAGAERVLLVPGDCPLLEPAEIGALLESAPEPPFALIVPDRHRTGTNALLLAPPEALPPAFGPGSCERHASSARAHGIESQVSPVASLALDVDTPEDLRALDEAMSLTHGGAGSTLGILRQLRRSAQL